MSLPISFVVIGDRDRRLPVERLLKRERTPFAIHDPDLGHRAEGQFLIAVFCVPEVKLRETVRAWSCHAIRFIVPHDTPDALITSIKEKELDGDRTIERMISFYDRPEEDGQC